MIVILLFSLSIISIAPQSYMRRGYLHIMRHGKTEANESGILTGSGLNPQLSKEGVLETKSLAKKLKSLKIKYDVVYISPAERVQHTYKLIREEIKKPMPEPILDERLIDRNFGKWTAVRKETLPTYRKAFVRPEDGESLYDLEQRVKPLLLDAEKKYKGGDRVLVIGHSHSVTAGLMTMIGTEYCDFGHVKLPNSCLLEIESQGELRLYKEVGVGLDIYPMLPDKARIFIVRHGMTFANESCICSGWGDSTLSPRGILSSMNIGKILKENGIQIDKIFSSDMTRSTMTYQLALIASQQDTEKVKIKRDWRLRERHYGSLQGKKGKELLQSYGAEVLHKIRRGYEESVPLGSNMTHIRSDLPEVARKVRGESTKEAYWRFLPAWLELLKTVKPNENILLVTHGNIIRAFLRNLLEMDEEKFQKKEVGMGVLYEYRPSHLQEKISIYGNSETMESDAKKLAQAWFDQPIVPSVDTTQLKKENSLKRLYVVKESESSLNAFGLNDKGWTDSYLSFDGVKRALFQSKFLKEKNIIDSIQKIYSSDSEQSRVTASLLMAYFSEKSVISLEKFVSLGSLRSRYEMIPHFICDKAMDSYLSLEEVNEKELLMNHYYINENRIDQWTMGEDEQQVWSRIKSGWEEVKKGVRESQGDVLFVCTQENWNRIIEHDFYEDKEKMSLEDSIVVLKISENKSLIFLKSYA